MLGSPGTARNVHLLGLFVFFVCDGVVVTTYALGVACRSWEITRTIESLQAKKVPLAAYDNYSSCQRDVIEILQSWSQQYAGKPEWKSLLNKANLCHEVEESMVALHHLQEWRNHTMNDHATLSDGLDRPFVAVDACCGKGVFSTLLSYMAPKHFPGLSRIILLDKDTHIDWSHIRAANALHKQDGRPFLELWAGTNLHEQDILVDKLVDYQQPLAITGIHLCKTLSPRLVGIANVLGKDRAPYVCLAPCCLPRSQQTLPIALYESPLQRQARLTATKHRAQARQRQSAAGPTCYVCQGQHHVRDCLERDNYVTEEAWNQVVQKAMLKLPCWRCGQLGHQRIHCTASIPSHVQPHAQLEMTTVLRREQDCTTGTTFERYCKALSQTLPHAATVKIVDSGLTCATHEQGNTKNWNRCRKSLYIVSTQ